MGTTDTKDISSVYVQLVLYLRVLGVVIDRRVPRVPTYIFCLGVFVMGTTSSKYVVYWGVGQGLMGTTGTKYISSEYVFL